MEQEVFFISSRRPASTPGWDAFISQDTQRDVAGGNTTPPLLERSDKDKELPLPLDKPQDTQDDMTQSTVIPPRMECLSITELSTWGDRITK